MSQQKMLQPGDLIWGKIQGYPYWPSIILYELPDGLRCRVQFYGDNSFGEIPYSELKRFEEHFDHYCIFAKKNSNLRQAIEIVIRDECPQMKNQFESNFSFIREIMKTNSLKQDPNKTVTIELNKNQLNKGESVIQLSIKQNENQIIEKKLSDQDQQQLNDEQQQQQYSIKQKEQIKKKKIETIFKKYFPEVQQQQISDALQICNNNEKALLKQLKAFSIKLANTDDKKFSIDSFDKFNHYQTQSQENFSFLHYTPEIYEIKLFF